MDNELLTILKGIGLLAFVAYCGFVFLNILRETELWYEEERQKEVDKEQ